MSRCIVVLVLCVLAHPLSAQSPGASESSAPDSSATPAPDSSATPDRTEAPQQSGDGASEQSARSGDGDDRAERLADYLSDVKFVGKFTVQGRPDAAPKEEEYTIARCEKLPAENMYRLTTRIQYGDVDNEVPLDLKILWAGDTPVITLDSLWIPGMGTFSSRVLIHSDRYSGTWQHGENGGHLFGKIVPNDDSP